MRNPRQSPIQSTKFREGFEGAHDPLLPGMPLDQIGQALANAYDSLVAEGVPEHLAGLVRRVARSMHENSSADRPIALVVEDEPDVRALAEAVLEESDLDVIGCGSAEEALAILRENGGRVALVFADIRLAGAMDGIQLARAVATLWPKARLVITSGCEVERHVEIPHDAVFIPKPWKAVDVLVEAGRAANDPPPVIA